MQGKRARRGLSVLLAIVLAAGLTVGFTPAALAEGPTFATTPAGAALAGMPLFNGNPADLEAYLDVLWDYYGVEGFAVHATEARNNSVGYYTLVKGSNAGKRIIAGHRAVDVNGGTSIGVPSSAGFAHTWNPALSQEVGTVAGDERLSTINHSYNQLQNLQANVYSSDADIRVNQNNGRFYNGFGGEDPMQTVVLAARWTGGQNGTLSPESNGGFWLKHSVGTKHFPNYGGEYSRQSFNVSTAARGLMEYQFITGVGLAKTNTVNGFMSSFGSTNGIPNVMTPIKKYVNSFAKYSQYSSPDYNAGGGLTSNNTNHGYQSYAGTLLDGAPNGSAQTALISLTRNQGGASAGQLDNAAPGNLWEAVYNPNYGGLWGITPEDVKLSGRDMLINMIRLGVFNERENYTNGRQLNWPYVNLSGSGTANTNLNGELMNYTNTDHQAVVLKAAQEIPVLLRNDNNLLPIRKSSKVYTLGYKSSYINYPQYNVGVHTAITNAGLAPYVGMQRVGGEDNVTNFSDIATNGQIVAIKASNGQYWYAPDGAGGQITTAAKPADGIFTDNYLFALFTYGQGTIWMQSLARNGSVAATNANNGAVTNTGNAVNFNTNLTSYNLRVEEGADGKYYLMVGNMAANTWTTYYNGRLLYNNDGTINVYSSQLTDPAAATTQKALAAAQFEFEVVREAGSTLPTDADYAVVYLGNNTLGLGEGSDRGGMDLGLAQNALASGVAKKYPGKTIVVVSTNEPLLLNELKEDPNIGAIVLAYSGGEYTSYALAQCIYGDVDFTGRTATTWYTSDDVFPAVDKYIGAASSTFNVDNVDPRYKYSNFTQTDPETTRLTYWYADPTDVAYAFGAGLSYAKFAYSNMVVGPLKADGSFDVRVDVNNTSSRASQEVLQLYASNPDSAYGDAAPKQKLVAFDKIALGAGASRTVTLNVDPLTISIWDVTRNDYLLESGAYKLYFGSDCYTPIISKTLNVTGNDLAVLRPSDPINVFDASFTARATTYREFSKANSIKGFRNGGAAEAYYVVNSLGNGSYTAVPNVDLNDVDSITASVGKQAAGASSIEVRLDAPDGPLYATIPVEQTEAVSYNSVDADGNPAGTTGIVPLHTTVQELGFVDKTAAIAGTAKTSGVHNLYFVFTGEDVRLNTFQLIYLDKADLAAAIAAYEAESKPADWQVLDAVAGANMNAYIKARETYNNPNATQAEVVAAAAALRELYESTGINSICNINDWLGRLAALYEVDYTPATWQAAVAAASAARVVYADANATGAQMNKAWNDLWTAMTNLGFVPRLKAAVGQPTTISLRVGLTAQIKLNSNIGVTYLSTNPSVVSVDPATGLLKGVKAGIAVITVKSVDNPSTPPLTFVVTCTV